MAAGSRHQQVRPAVAATAVLLLFAVSGGTAFGATNPDPSPSASPAAADPSPLDSDLNEIATSDQDVDGLSVAIDRWIPYTTTATAVGGGGLATATLPIPNGLVPVRLRGDLVSIADTPGVVRIRVGTNWVEMDAETGGRFSIAVPIDTVVDNTLTVEVRNTLEPGAGECQGDFSTTETIKNLEIGFVGRETPPTTIAGFFSPPVQKVTIVFPDEVTMETAQATLATAGAVARRYDRTVPIRSETESAFSADPSGLVDTDGPNRIVRLESTNAQEVTVEITNPGVPTMTLSGPPAELSKAGASLASANLGLASVPTATDLSEVRFAQPTSTLTLGDLGNAKPSLAGLGRLVYSLSIPQDRFGTPVDSIAIHLEGAHTPVPQGGLATVSILWNDQLVASQQLSTDDDSYSADLSIDGTLVRRDNIMSVRMDATPPGGTCGTATQPMQLDLNGLASTLVATPGQSLRAGFDRFPQAFGSTIHVAFGSGPMTAASLKAACSVLISLQRAATTQLALTVEDFATFLNQPYPGLVVGATPDDADALRAPLRYEEFRQINSNLTDFSVTVDAPFAAFEAFETDGRNLLMLGSTAPAEQSQVLINQLADEVENGEFGWFRLRDSLMVAQPASPTFFFDATTLVPQASVTDEGRKLPPWWVFLIVTLAVLLLLRWWMLRRYKKRTTMPIEDAREVDAEQVDEYLDPTDPP